MVPFVAAATLMVGACTDQSPTGLRQVSRHARASEVGGGSGRPTLFRNAIKYRDAGLKPATGRSGSAALMARALLGKDGVTTLDISTGDLEAGTVHGTLKKVQLKRFDPNGNLQLTENYRDIGAATARLLISGRARGSALQVQGNVTDIDPSRTDVVTVTETVKLRPDLTVSSVSAPVHAVVATPVTVSAIVTEINGDVGARADCVLSVDGTDVDQSTGIWVDAGRAVSCEFMHTFTTLGSKSLRVSVVNVQPGDYDASNNTASADIEIVQPPSTNDFTWDASLAGQNNFHQTDRYNGYWYYTDQPYHAEWSYQHEYFRYSYIQTSITGQATSTVGDPSEVHFTDQVDGTVVHDIAFDPATDRHTVIDQSWYDGQNYFPVHGGCIDLQRTVPGNYNGTVADFYVASMSVCSVASTGDGAPSYMTYTNFSVGTAAGDVSYYSNEYYHSVYLWYYGTEEETYAINATFTQSWGDLTFGNAYSFTLSVTGPNGTKMAAGSVPIVSQPVQLSIPYTCTDDNSGTYVNHYCQALDYSGTQYNGYAHGTSDN